MIPQRDAIVDQDVRPATLQSFSMAQGWSSPKLRLPITQRTGDPDLQYSYEWRPYRPRTFRKAVEKNQWLSEARSLLVVSGSWRDAGLVPGLGCPGPKVGSKVPALKFLLSH